MISSRMCFGRTRISRKSRHLTLSNLSNLPVFFNKSRLIFCGSSIAYSGDDSSDKRWAMNNGDAIRYKCVAWRKRKDAGEKRQRVLGGVEARWERALRWGASARQELPPPPQPVQSGCMPWVLPLTFTSDGALEISNLAFSTWLGTFCPWAEAWGTLFYLT